jgi:molecular chaperone GrpE
MNGFRQRMTALSDQRVERKAGELIEQFFEPVQNLRRSLQAKEADPTATIAGLEMILQQFTEVLAKLGLQEIPALGVPFDPSIHEALATMPVTDPAQDGKVILVHATGYRIGDRVLQPAQVVIGKLRETIAEA